MVEQTGEEIDWDRCPPEAEDFPQIVIDSINMYHSLGNRMYPEIGYMGKDYTNLPLLFKLYKIQEHQEEYVYELLLYLDNRAIELSQQKLKAEYDKIKQR
tara:strand:- start:11 stop:310 length:300 start_codon:yes stop_codon:yes gene_type:complete